MKRRTFIQALGAFGAATVLSGAGRFSRTVMPVPIPDHPENILLDLIKAAKSSGAVYADARFVLLQSESLQVRRDLFYSALENESAGIALRVYKGGNWGMAATAFTGETDTRALAQTACSLAAAKGAVQKVPFSEAGRIVKAHTPWKSACKIDPFDVPLGQKVDFLLELSAPPLSKEGIAYSVANLFVSKKRVWYVNSLGGSTDQTYTVTYPNFGLTAFLQSRGRIDSRNSDIEPVQAGWEIAAEYGFKEEVQRAVNEVLEKNNLAQFVAPASFDLVLASSHLWKVIYDTLAPHIDPYTILGLDGDSTKNALFSRTDIGRKTFSTPRFNLEFDNRIPRGLASTEVDDAGMPSANGTFFRKGIFQSLPGSDELAGFETEWKGSSTRAESWDQQPKFAMPNLIFLPGTQPLSAKDLIRDVKKGLYITGRSQTLLSPDRKSFRATGQLGWLIENGEIKHMVRDFVYEGSTISFWNMLDELGGNETVTIGGDIFPQNNSPIWLSPYSIAAPAARFTNINVFSTQGGAK